MRQNELGDVIGHVAATTDKPYGEAPSSVTRSGLVFHSDSSDVVGLLCLRPAMEGGQSSLVSAATVYNEVVRRRPDLAPLLFEPWYWDWHSQDPEAPQPFYVSPIVSLVDGVFSMYAGTTIIYSAQDYPGVPPLTPAQRELLALLDAIPEEPGMRLDMDFQPGDIQWLLNFAALHSRTAFVDYPEPERRRHLLRLWLHRDVGRPLVPGFGKSAVQSRTDGRDPGHADERGAFSIGEATVQRMDWGLTRG
jgi:hypothetical protein